jgi:hypothetical protein
MVGVTLRYPYEVHQADEYFEATEDEKVPKDMLDLAIHIVDSKRGSFEPQKFEDCMARVVGSSAFSRDRSLLRLSVASLQRSAILSTATTTTPGHFR